ncbi:MAG: hypothetical protein ABEI98_01550 [Halorhabdus sp.]
MFVKIDAWGGLMILLAALAVVVLVFYPDAVANAIPSGVSLPNIDFSIGVIAP